MPSKEITESEMRLLRRTLIGYDKAAMWSVLKRLNLSIYDTPFYGEEEADYDDVDDEPWGFSGPGPEYYIYYLDNKRHDQPISVRGFVIRKKCVAAIAAFKHGTFEDFKLFEEFKSHGHTHGWDDSAVVQSVPEP